MTPNCSHNGLTFGIFDISDDRSDLKPDPVILKAHWRNCREFYYLYHPFCNAFAPEPSVLEPSCPVQNDWSGIRPFRLFLEPTTRTDRSRTHPPPEPPVLEPTRHQNQSFGTAPAPEPSVLEAACRRTARSGALHHQKSLLEYKNIIPRLWT